MHGNGPDTQNQKERQMTLGDTASMMQSNDYEDRFAAEHAQTKIRRDKLANMLHDWDKGTLGFDPECPRSIYNLQIRAMDDYITVLEARAAIEGVDLLV